MPSQGGKNGNNPLHLPGSVLPRWPLIAAWAGCASMPGSRTRRRRSRLRSLAVMRSIEITHRRRRNPADDRSRRELAGVDPRLEVQEPALHLGYQVCVANCDGLSGGRTTRRREQGRGRAVERRAVTGELARGHDLRPHAIAHTQRRCGMCPAMAPRVSTATAVNSKHTHLRFFPEIARDAHGRHGRVQASAANTWSQAAFTAAA